MYQSKLAAGEVTPDPHKLRKAEPKPTKEPADAKTTPPTKTGGE